MDFSGYQYLSDIILLAVRYYVSYKLSYRDIEEILAERGCFVDHSTINRWVINFAPMTESKARQIKRPVSLPLEERVNLKLIQPVMSGLLRHYL